MSATRPTGFPGWASGPSGYVTEPDATTKALGWQPTGVARSAYFNWLGLVTYQWLKYLDERPDPHFGDGSDGSWTLSPTGATTPLWAGYSAGCYYLNRDVALQALTLTGGSGSDVVHANGFRLRVRDVLDTTGGGRVSVRGAQGGNASTGATGVGAPAGNIGTVFGGAPGGHGGAVGGPGANAGGFYSDSLGATGGTGGSGDGGGPAAGGGAVALLAARGDLRAMPAAALGHVAGTTGSSGVQVTTPVRGGAGGGGGGNGAGTSGAYGGGGGGGGGVLVVVARELKLGAASDLCAAGGQGGNAGGGLNIGGGGGGGGGGVVVAVYRKSNVTLSAAACAPGGIGGNPVGGGGGKTGLTGFIGSLIDLGG